MKIAGLGWIPDLPDVRDVEHRFLPTLVRLPPSGSLDHALMPPKFNQLRAGSCTGASTSRAGMYLIARQGQPRVPGGMSALFPYFNGRDREGNAGSDAGAQIRDVVKGIVEFGLCAESLWPYDTKKVTTKPSERAYRDAHFTVLNKYQRIEPAGDARIELIRAAIANGNPVVFGFTVYESFETAEVANTGIMPMPRRGERVIGGHAVWDWQYDDNRRALRIRNSWGDWGIDGDFWMPYEYAANENLAADFWVLSNVT